LIGAAALVVVGGLVGAALLSGLVPVGTRPAEEADEEAKPGATVTSAQQAEVVSAPTEVVQFAEGDVLFEDDFEDGGATSWMVDWGSWRVVEEEDGNGNLAYYSELGETFLPMSQNWTDYAIDMRVK
jgi:hypothetical protein